MRIIAVLAFATIALSGCTVFQDDIYKAQAGYYLSDNFDAVEAAIHDEFTERFGEARVAFHRRSRGVERPIPIAVDQRDR